MLAAQLLGNDLVQFSLLGFVCLDVFNCLHNIVHLLTLGVLLALGIQVLKVKFNESADLLHLLLLVDDDISRSDLDFGDCKRQNQIEFRHLDDDDFAFVNCNRYSL